MAVATTVTTVATAAGCCCGDGSDGCRSRRGGRVQLLFGPHSFESLTLWEWPPCGPSSPARLQRARTMFAESCTVGHIRIAPRCHGFSHECSAWEILLWNVKKHRRFIHPQWYGGRRSQAFVGASLQRKFDSLGHWTAKPIWFRSRCFGFGQASAPPNRFR